MKKVIFSAIALSMIVFACQKEEVVKEITSKNKTSIVNRSFTDDEIEQIGIIHNDFLEKSFQNFNYSSIDKKEELKSKMNNEVLLKDENIIVNWDLIETNVNNNIELLNNKLSLKANNIIEESINAYENLITVTEFKDKMFQLENQAKVNLKGKDLDAVLITLCVFRYSAEFWASPEIGGNGKGYQILLNLNDGVTPSAFPPGAADALGAAGAFIGGAFVTFFTAGTGAGIFYGVGWSAAWASGIAALDK